MPRFDTDAVHAGETLDPSMSLDPPVVLSSAFAFESAEDAATRFARGDRDGIYTRWGNPTVRTFERKVATLEGAEDAVATASGMGAIFGSLASCLRSGAHVVAPLGVYAETAKLLRSHFATFGVSTDFVDMTDHARVNEAIKPETAVIWCETPANPVLDVYDIAALAGIAASAGATLIVDSTFATPYHQRPLALGAQLVVHSATKAIGGHGDAVGGVVCGDAARIAAVQAQAVRATGNAMAPWTAFLLTRGLRTLGLRMDRASASAALLAHRLTSHPKVRRVRYPGLAVHPGHELAQRQMTNGFGSLLAFEVEGGVAGAARAYDRLELVARAVSLGDLRTLATCPAATTHASMPAEQRRAAGIADGLLRLSVGIEHVEDLWEDLERALS